VLRPTAGTIWLDGQDITNLEAHKRVQLGIARTFQINQLFAELTPLETIGLCGLRAQWSSAARWWRQVGSKGIVIEESVDILQRFQLRRRDGTSAPARCPMASSACSRSRSRSPCRPRVLLARRARPPASRRPSGATFSMRWRAAPPTSPCC
jgi:branched-chain amino acid transport system ATP-binding protein